MAMSLVYTFIFLFLCGISQSRGDDDQVKVIIFFDGSMDYNYTTDLDCASIANLIDYIDPTKPTAIFAPGFNFTLDGKAVKSVISSLQANNYNAMLLDWHVQASAESLLPYSATYLTKGIPNALLTGCELGKVLVCLIKAAKLRNLDLSNIYLIGHSLGAHVMGKAGDCAKQGGYTLEHITGLDPAGPGFDKILGVLPTVPGLDRDCAKHVDIVHTDPNGLGSKQDRGHVDFYVNFGDALQPGCTDQTNLLGNVLGNPKESCNHNRAWMLFSEALYHPSNLPGSHAVDGNTWLQAGGDANDLAYIGSNLNVGASGKYFLRTAGQSPFGLGIAGTQP